MLDPHSKGCQYAKITGAWKPRAVKQILRIPHDGAAAAGGDEQNAGEGGQGESEAGPDENNGENEDKDEEEDEQHQQDRRVVYIDGIQILPGMVNLLTDDEDEEAEFGVCVCGAEWRQDDTREFVECTECRAWLHCECVEYDPEEEKEDEE